MKTGAFSLQIAFLNILKITTHIHFVQVMEFKQHCITVQIANRIHLVVKNKETKRLNVQGLPKWVQFEYCSHCAWHNKPTRNSQKRLKLLICDKSWDVTPWHLIQACHIKESKYVKGSACVWVHFYACTNLSSSLTLLNINHSSPVAWWIQGRGA